jgi:DDE superfamily endonuclease
LCQLDEAGFAMTLPTRYSWFLQGERLEIAYEAPQGRRVNVIGAHFTHGPEAGRLEYQRWAALPKRRAKQHRKSEEERAATHGLKAEEVGAIDAERVVSFLWQIAGRPTGADGTWKRARPLVIALDNYSVHRSEKVEEARVALAAAGGQLMYLARYSPAQSGIEPVWNDVKQHHLPVRSFERVADLKHAVDQALAQKAHQLKLAAAQTTNLHHRPT